MSDRSRPRHRDSYRPSIMASSFVCATLLFGCRLDRPGVPLHVNEDPMCAPEVCAADWFDTDWVYRLSLTIDSSRVFADLDNFPVLVRVLDSQWQGAVQPSGADIVFVTEDGRAQYAHEIESFQNGELFAWVNLPSLSSSEDTRLYLYYGNPDSADQQRADQVWDDDYQGVWHLTENATDEVAVVSHTDSSGYGNDGQQSGNRHTAGMIAQAQEFDGNDDEIVIPSAQNFALGDADCTISTWIRTDTTRSSGIVVKAPSDSHEYRDAMLGINHLPLHPNRLSYDAGFVTNINGTSTINDNAWHHVAWVQLHNDDGNNERWYLWVDGVEEATRTAATGADSPSHTLRIGGRAPGSLFPNFFNGVVDEVRISSQARSQAWLVTSFRNQSSPGDFVMVGSEESLN